MLAEEKVLIQHCLSYASLQRSSDVISDRQFKGIQVALETVSPDKVLFVCNLVLHSLNEIYERKLTQWLESNSVIIRP